VYVMSFSRPSNFHVRVQVADLCSKLCHLKYKVVTSFTVVTEKGGNEIKV
jgi:hypothetical protein